VNYGTGNQPRLLTFGGTNTGANTFGKVLANNTLATSVTKTGAGTWILDQVNTYSGATNVNQGIFSINARNSRSLRFPKRRCTIQSRDRLHGEVMLHEPGRILETRQNVFARERRKCHDHVVDRERENGQARLPCW
jgi:autotransporter-associated beta strand protein